MHTANLHRYRKEYENMIANKGPGWTPVGFKDLGLRPGEELKLIRGEIFQALPPEKITVVRENDRFIMLELTFVRGRFQVPNSEPRKTRICVGKGAMLCGDVILARAKDHIPLIGKKVADRYVYIG